MNVVLNIIQKKINYILWVFIFLYTVAAISVSVNRYWQYQTFYFDFGIYDTAIWKVAHFQLPLVDHVDISNRNIVIFGDHFNPSVFILSPLYWFLDRREIILIAQVLMVSLASIIGFLISSKFLKSRIATIALVVAFLGYVGMQNALISDFHEATISVLFLMLIFWAIFNKKNKLYFLFLILFLGFKETFAGLGVAIGLYLIIQDRRNFKKAILTIIISLVYGIVAVKFLIPFFSGGIYLYTPHNLQFDLQSTISKFIYPDLHWKTIAYTYLTFGFLPVFDLSILPAIFENFFERFVLSQKGNDLGMHYNAPLVPFMFIGAMYTLKLLENKFNAVVTFYSFTIIFIVLFLHRFTLHGPLGLSYNKAFYEQNERVKYVDEFVANFPKEGLIMTQNDLAVRLTHQDVKLLRKNYKIINPDVVILNLTPGQNPNSFFPLLYNDAVNLKEQLLKDGNYQVQKFTDEQYIFSKK